MREKVRHARNLAMRQMVGSSDSQPEVTRGDNSERGDRTPGAEVGDALVEWKLG